MSTFIRQLISICLLTLCSLPVSAVPARPGRIAYRQPDGTTVNVYLRGDEYMHFYESDDGVIMLAGGDKTLRYAHVTAQGMVEPTGHAAHDAAMRTAEEKRLLASIDQDAVRQGLRDIHFQKLSAVRNRPFRAASGGMPGEIKSTFPTTGNIRGVIILAQFTDVKFSRDDIAEVYDDMANSDDYSGPYSTGSIKNYFTAQSDGKFVPTFDIVGPVDLPHSMAYYGIDERAAELMIDACNVADATADVDFSQYDYNADGYVDFVFVVYAGYGQAQGGGDDTVWPQAVDLTYESWNLYDGLYLSQAACSCELKGYEGGVIDGIGTFCHEFSHILGLPDIYDPVYSGMSGMLTWDVMDKGLYNNGSMTPAGYTAMDKYTVGWLTPTVLSEPASGVRLAPLSEGGGAYFIVCDADNNEYYTLENRQLTGWDSGLGGHGLIISHIHYVPSLWASNRVNTSSSVYEHVALVPADNAADESTLAGDPFPGTSGNTVFTDYSEPASSWHTTAALADCPITNISEADGIITFDFKADHAGLRPVSVDGEVHVEVSGGIVSVDNPLRRRVCIFSADGRLIHSSSQERIKLCAPRGVYVVKCFAK